MINTEGNKASKTPFLLIIRLKDTAAMSATFTVVSPL